MTNKQYYSFFIIAISAVCLVAAVPKETNEAICNCVGCQTSNHPLGTNSWCRCCEQALRPECDSSPLCAASLFDGASCLAQGYGKTRCTTSGQELTPVLLSEPIPATVAPVATTPRQTPVERSLFEQPACNCVLCENSGLYKYGPNYCRCCRTAYLMSENMCRYHSGCDDNVFELEGCEANNWRENCNFTANFIVGEGTAEPTTPPADDTTDPHYRYSPLWLTCLFGALMVLFCVTTGCVSIKACTQRTKIGNLEAAMESKRRRSRSSGRHSGSSTENSWAFRRNVERTH